MRARRPAPSARRPLTPAAVALWLGLAWPGVGHAQAQAMAGSGLPGLPGVPALTLESLPRPAAPPIERGPVLPDQVERWRAEARAFELGDGYPRDPLRAAELYCRAARHGDAESQYSLGWMYANGRGIERDDAAAAHLFAAAAEQGLPQALNLSARMGTPMGDPPPCLRPPAEDRQLLQAALAAQAAPPPGRAPRPGAAPGRPPPPPLPPNATPQVVSYVNLVAPEYRLEPYLVLAIIATESNFDPLALSPKRAQGLMQLIPETAARFGVRNAMDPAQNIRGGMAYLRWLLAYFEGDVMLAAAAYNAGEGAVERYRGVPPYAETRNYVRKVLSLIQYRVSHPYDASVTPPSQLAARIRERMKSPG